MGIFRANSVRHDNLGFRPGRKQHDALDALWVGLKRRRVNWVLDLDVRGFFDNVSHEWLVKFVEHRIADRRMIRLIQKWLKAGVSEHGTTQESAKGTPQGAVISPLLANVYLHYALDLWAQAARHPEVADGAIDAPLVVIGLFRAGTTLLSHLLDQGLVGAVMRQKRVIRRPHYRLCTKTRPCGTHKQRVPWPGPH